MSNRNQPAGGDTVPELTEERYCLRDMLAEVKMETRAGALGAEKLHQKDIRKLFRAKSPRPRATKS